MPQIPTGPLRALDDAADPISGAKLYIYDAGTTTPASIYSDDDLTASLANPLLADSVGRWDQAFASEGQYKLRATTPADVLLWEEDFVTVFTDPDDVQPRDPELTTLSAATALGLDLARAVDLKDGQQILGVKTNIISYGAAVNGATDDSPAFNDMLDAEGLIRIPTGRTYVNTTIEAETGDGADAGDVSWYGLSGDGHGSIIELGPSGKIVLQNFDPGGSLGDIQYTPQGISNLTIDGNSQTAPYGVVMGTDTDAGDDELAKSSNGTLCYNMDVFDCEVGLARGFTTNNHLLNCTFRDNDYGAFSYTSENFTASDITTFETCRFNSNDIAGLVEYHDTANHIKNMYSGAMVSLNVGWGAVIQGDDSRPTVFMPLGHFENNGTKVSGGAVATAADVTVKDINLTAEPGHLYVKGATMIGDAVDFFNGFIRLDEDARLHLRGGGLIPGVVSASDYVPLFKDCHTSADVVLEGTTFTNPGIETDATFIYSGPVNMQGTTSGMSFIQTRIPMAAKLRDTTIMPDPMFQNTFNGLTASASGPSLSLAADEGYLGGNAMRVQFTSASGGLNVNAVRCNSLINTVATDEYVAFTSFMRADAETTIRIQPFSSEDASGMGSPDVTLPANEWVRIAVLWHNKYGAQTTSNVFGIFPTGTDGPRIDFDGFEVTKGAPRDVLATLQGYIGQRMPIMKNVTIDINNVPAGSYASTVVTVEGATVDDDVSFSGQNLAGLFVQPQVSAADTVTLHMHNPTSGGIDPSSDTYTVTVRPR